MFQESALAKEASNDIQRYHHLTGCLLSGGCAIESFLNSNRRTQLERNGIGDERITKELRYTSLRTKMETWPSEFSGVSFEANDLAVITEFLELRNEVTHRKRRDHSLYQELDETMPDRFVVAVQEAFVTTYAGLNQSFPYWLLGWNFVGVNGDEAHPCLLNSQQFKHALLHMGFRVPAWEYDAANAWEESNMKGVGAFRELKTAYYDKAPVIEPRNPMFPMAPRLCKRWWDAELIYGA